ncbi:hypothetical protein C5167_004479 [Papaver somniferum]|uniref:Uncharacterized protein n=1 Tax=Papaver somniferum TaxID=3469 RepID=A0A4Y7JAY7_PAPSO|nr:hypothetical protein C5167_004479 [Papaver somniferum]
MQVLKPKRRGGPKNAPAKVKPASLDSDKEDEVPSLAEAVEQPLTRARKLHTHIFDKGYKIDPTVVAKEAR